MCSDIAISVRGLGKCYQIYQKPRDRLLQMLARGRKQLYREFWSLRNVDFEIRRGQTVGIIGRNGAGKSTLLQLICGTLNPTEGDVFTHGRIAALLELGSGFNPEFSGRENVYLNATLFGLTKDEIDEKFASIIDFAEILEFIDQPVKTYSSGMFVRLAFAVVVHVNADILIVDEALAVGDIRFQNKCLRKLNELKEAGTSILFVSHSPGAVEAFCDHAVWLEGGKVQGQGKPADLVRDYVNAMSHGLNPDVDGSATAVRDDESLAANSVCSDWHWTLVTPKHNARHVSRARIEAIRVRINGEPSVTTIDPTPSRLEIEARISVSAPIGRPLIAAGIFNHLNEPIVHVNTFNLNAAPEPITVSGAAIMRAALEIPALRPGEYLVSIGIDDGEPGASEVLSHVYGAWALRVKPPTGRRDQGGYIQLANVTMTLAEEGDIS